MPNQTLSRLSKPASMKTIVAVVAAMISFLIICYGLLWFLAKQQQQSEVETFLYDVASNLNHKIDDKDKLEDISFTPSIEIENYQLLIFSPDNHIMTIQNDLANTSVILPAWKLSNPNTRQVYRKLDGFEAWYPLHDHYRLYANVQFNTIWESFDNPLYALPLLWVFCSLLLFNIQLQKRQQDWQIVTEYLDQLPQTVATGYRPLSINYQQALPEVRHLAHLLNRLSYKMTQYHEQSTELFYRQNALIDNAPVALFLISRKGKLLYFNNQFAQTFNTSFNSQVIYMLSDFITGMDKAAQQRLNNLQAHQFLETLSVTDLQHELYFDLFLTPFYNRFGKLKGFSGTLQVVTQYHSQLQKSWLEDKKYSDKIASLEKLWAILGHELRTPLSGMIGMINLLSEDKNQFNQEQQETLTTIQQSSQTMLQLLNDMLDMAKLDAGKLQSNIASVDLLLLMRQVAELMIGNAKTNNISLYLIADPMLPHYFDSDDGRLRQILLNLMSNAIKFTQQGYVALLADKLTRDHPIIQQKLLDNQQAIAVHWLRLTVKDTGIGISAQEQKKLFSYFNQANDSISQQFGGTGLGLAISNNFTQMLGGFIHLVSETGKGSEFQVYLPLSKFSLQPAFDFGIKHLNIYLIIISPYDVLQLFNRFLQYYDLVGILITKIDQAMVQKINAINFLDLMPIFIVDDVGYLGNEALFKNIPVFNNSRKLVCSMDTERTINPDLLMQFDGVLPKPVTVSSMFAEISRLYYQNNLPSDGVSSLPAQAAFKQFLQQHADILQTPKLTTNPASIVNVINSPHHTILLAEDNPVNQKIAQRQLIKLGYNVLIADNGQTAIELLKSHRKEINLVLMDCRMPILDGIEATRMIRANKDSIPIIALTANDTDEDRKICIAAGMDNFLTKPLNKDSLSALLKRYLI